MQKPYEIYVDYDGVCCDYFRGFKEVSGKSWTDPYWTTHGGREAKENIIRAHSHWWENLPPERDFDQLWGFVKNFEPHILTAYAEWDEKASRAGKWVWNQKHTHVPHERFHCVLRESKRYFAKEHDGSHFGRSNVLIDDYPQNIEEFNAAGGIGILHTSAADTINKLKQLGFSTK